jgi:SAM-dependent methyltransferase
MKRFFEYLIGELRYVFGRYAFQLGDLDWDDAYKTQKIYFQNRYYVIAGLLDEQSKPMTVADIGAGSGDLLGYLLKQHIITPSSIGVDSAASSVDRIRTFGFQGIQADISRSDFHLPEKVDVVIMAEIVEHIRDVEIPLRNLKSAYRRGIVVTTPNLGYLWFRLRLLFGRFPYIRELPPREHVRFWTVGDFKQWARQLGFTTVDVRGCGGFPILYRLWPSLFAYDVLYFIR